MQGIKYLDYYIPERRLEIDVFLEQLPDAFVPRTFRDKAAYAGFLTGVLRLGGINCETQLSPAGMLDGLLDKMFGSRIVLPEMIDLVLVTGREGGESLADGLGQYLHSRHGMNKAYILELAGNNCANVDFAIDTACQLLQGYKFKHILVTAVNLIRRPEERIVGSYALLGDGAGIVLLSKNEAVLSPKGSEMLVNGMLHEGDLEGDHSIELFKYYVECLENIQKRACINDGQISHILVQNANPLLVMPSIESAGLGKDKIFTANFGRWGHLDCVDSIVNLADIARTSLPRDKYVLTFSTGVRGSYISMLLKPC